MEKAHKSFNRFSSGLQLLQSWICKLVIMIIVVGCAYLSNFWLVAMTANLYGKVKYLQTNKQQILLRRFGYGNNACFSAGAFNNQASSLRYTGAPDDMFHDTVSLGIFLDALASLRPHRPRIATDNLRIQTWILRLSRHSF